MLVELQRIFDRDETLNLDDFRKAAATLMERQFLFADKRRDKGFYSQILKYRDYYQNLFDGLNLDLLCDPGIGYLGIVPRGGAMAQRLDTEHTLVLLVLRVNYENVVLECRAMEGGQVMTDSDKLMDVYERQTGKKKPGLVRLREILTTFSRQGLLDFDGEEDRVIQVRIRPSIRDIVTPGWIETLEEYAASRADGDQDESQQEGDHDPVD